MNLKRLKALFAVVKLAPSAPLPDWATQSTPLFIARTSDELSIMCPQATVPTDIEASRDYVCFRVDGELDFDQVGVVASVSSPIANAGISLFLVSTHDRDYVLIHRDDVEKAITVYESHGFAVLHVL